MKDELTVTTDQTTILGGPHILLPSSLCGKAIEIAHKGHQELVKTKTLLRQKAWFPGIDLLAKQLLGNCMSCQAQGPNSRPEPLTMTTLPPEPWSTINIDFWVQSQEVNIYL